MPDPIAALTLRVAIYARVSSDEQRDGQTINSQIAELERFALEKAWLLVGIYKDDGWSGALLNRPELDRLRDAAASKQFDIVLINDVDRLARDVAHLGIVKRDLERHGVKVVFRKLPQDESPTYNLMVNVLGSFAEFEREMILDRTRRGRRHKVEARGQFIGAIGSYGYRYVPRDRSAGRDGYLEIVPEEASLVRQMYEWVDKESLSARKVVVRLNELVMKPRTGSRWAKSTVLRILRNETYAGVWHYNKRYGSTPRKPKDGAKYRRSLKTSNRLRRREEWWPVTLSEGLRIVPRDLWERVQVQLSKNKAFSPRNMKHSYLLKGLVRCGRCGAAYVGYPCHGQFYYRCSRPCKLTPMVREVRLNEVVLDAITEAMLNPDLILSQVHKLQKLMVEGDEAGKTELRSMRRALEQVRLEETRLLEGYRSGIISPTQLGQELAGLKQRQGTLEVRLRHLLRNSEQTNNRYVGSSVEEYCKAAAARIENFSQDESQHFLRLLIEHVIFDGSKVRIRAIIPVNKDSHGGQTADRLARRIGVGDKDIAAEGAQIYGRNAFIDNAGVVDTGLDLGGRNAAPSNYSEALRDAEGNFLDYVSFELCKVLPEKPFSILSDEGLELVRLLKQKWSDPTLQELCDGVQKERGDVVSLSAMSRALRRLNLSPTRRGPRLRNARHL